MSVMITPKGRHRRYRKLFQFQLDLNDPEEKAIAQEIHDLKRERSYSKTIRDGIRLVADLRKGKTDVLRELFPWVMEQKEEISTPTVVDPSDKISSILKAEIERLTAILTQHGMNSIEPSTAAPPVRSTMKPATNPADMLEIKQAQRSGDDKPTWNFMISSALSVYGHCNFLPADIKEYGVRTGRIQPEMILAKPAASAHNMDGNAKKLPTTKTIEPTISDEIEVPLGF